MTLSVRVWRAHHLCIEVVTVIGNNNVATIFVRLPCIELRPWPHVLGYFLSVFSNSAPTRTVFESYLRLPHVYKNVGHVWTVAVQYIRRNNLRFRKEPDTCGRALRRWVFLTQQMRLLCDYCLQSLFSCCKVVEMASNPFCSQGRQ